MKIVEIVPCLTKGGGEVFVSQLSSCLKNVFNDDVYLVLLYDDNDQYLHDYIEKDCNIPIYHCHKKKGLDIKTSKVLRKIIRDINPDIVHTHLRVDISYFLAFRFKKTSWRRVHTVHSVPNKEMSRFMYSLRKAYTKRNLLKLIGITNNIHLELSSFFGNDSCFLIRNGANFPTVKKDKVIYDYICVARFYPVKNHKLLIDAFDSVWHENNALTLALVGDGPLFDEMKCYASSLDCGCNISFLGKQNDVFLFLNKSKVFVLSSLYEGNPISIIEALSQRMPVIAPNVGGIPDVIRHMENGLLFDINDVDSLVKMMKLINDNEIYTALVQNETEIKELSMEKCAEKYHNLFTDICANRKA